MMSAFISPEWGGVLLDFMASTAVILYSLSVLPSLKGQTVLEEGGCRQRFCEGVCHLVSRVDGVHGYVLPDI